MTHTVEPTAVVRAADAGTWFLCDGCRIPIYGPRLARNLHVCPDCGTHRRLTARQRLAQLADDGDYALLPHAVDQSDPLGWRDTEPYEVRLAAARAATDMDEAVLSARARIEGHPVVLVAMDFRFLGGSLGSATGELITLALETALAERTPVVLATASGGARMQEGALSLMQMAKTSAALGALDQAGILTVCLVTDPTFGGVAASFATLGDVVVAEPGARLGFAGRRVIEQTIGQELPPDFQTAEFLLARGLVDMVVPRAELRRTLGRLLGCRRGDRPPERTAASPSGGGGDAVVVTEPDGLGHGVDAWRSVAEARRLDRPRVTDYLAGAFHDFVELHGDRVTGECTAVVGGTARLDGRPVVVVGTRKGHTPDELVRHRFGMASPSGYRKAARLMRLADKLGLPVVTLVDTPGAHPGAEAEERGQSVAIAENLRLMAALRVPVVSVVVGEGGSGGALGLAVANRVLMLSHATYSVISPEGCAAIVWRDPSAAPAAARALQLAAPDLLRHGVVDGVVPEPDGGVGAAPHEAVDRLRRAVGQALAELDGLSGDELAADRRARFRRFGAASLADHELDAELDAALVWQQAADGGAGRRGDRSFRSVPSRVAGSATRLGTEPSGPDGR